MATSKSVDPLGSESGRREDERDQREQEGAQVHEADCSSVRHGAITRVGDLEEITLLDAEKVADNDVGWEALDRRVQLADGAIVEAARHFDLVLGVRKFVLQVEEILVGFEVGIGFAETR
jgi:hypothetical protein